MPASELREIAELSRFYGNNPDFVFLGGGNCSVKNADLLHIKPSGVALAKLQGKDLLTLRRDRLAEIFALPPELSCDEREAQVKKIMQDSMMPGQAGRPSVEAPLHQLIDYTFVMHLHPTLVNGMLCSQQARQSCQKLFPEALFLDYCDPGSSLAKQVDEALRQNPLSQGRQRQIIFLQNHGVFVAADSCAEIKDIYEHIFSRLKLAYQEAAICGEIALEEADPAFVQEIAPLLRQRLSKDSEQRALLHLLGKGSAFAGPLTPDHIVYAKSFAYVGDGEPASLQAFEQKHSYAPKLLDISGKALFASAADLKEAQDIKTALLNARQIEALSQAFGGPRYLDAKQYRFIENWEAESYRRSVQQSRAGRLNKRVCLVTGAAQGFGLGIADQLCAQDGIVIIADINLEAAQKAAEALCQKYGELRALAMKVNIADEDSVQALFASLAATCGGLDLLVANAGVLRAGSVLEMSLEDWNFVTNINYTGYFLCVKHAARLMARQNQGGLDSDIVQVNSKSGLEGSNKNAAYAGSKFGAIGLTQSFAKELLEYNIRVNSVCPGNYYDGPLWSDPEKGLFTQYLHTGKVPGAQSAADVRRFYEDKVPMRRGCQPEDVARAIIYCIEQKYETGQAIPVTGGQVMLH
ncbi:MAG: SDR family NAD(P)-dependent oxidoreductase [Lentisphaerae bacterium]|nr:SDR family NAD(P)-dependent oxidoreductase [Lentisphaerota bacterium]